MAVDPVCHTQVDESKAALRAVYLGEVYHFCSSSCKAAFDRQPQRYAGTSPDEPAWNGARHGIRGFFGTPRR